MNSLFDDLDNKNKCVKFDLPDAEIEFYPCFFNGSESKFFMTTLKNEIDWRQDKMNIYGKEVNLPRLTAWYGENDKNYSFSGITLKPMYWTDSLLQIKKAIEAVETTYFNSVLLNLYRNGQDSINWHTDAEKELGKNPIIASVSFGETRKFQLKHRYNKDLDIINIDLLNGSLLIMKGETQHFWLHQIPKTTKVIGERINLTFRTIK
jgi:alkylated DNA repair dioxygenase AlkB